MHLCKNIRRINYARHIHIHEIGMTIFQNEESELKSVRDISISSYPVINHVTH